MEIPKGERRKTEVGNNKRSESVSCSWGKLRFFILGE
jgi:hypothetical protein